MPCAHAANLTHTPDIVTLLGCTQAAGSLSTSRQPFECASEQAPLFDLPAGIGRHPAYLFTIQPDYPAIPHRHRQTRPDNVAI